jgi:C1A family cysteine protease
MNLTTKIICALAVTQLSLASAFADTSFEKTYLTRDYGVTHAKGLVRSAKSNLFLASAKRESFLTATASVPKAYSLRGKAGPVEDQGQCGSCWDFSLTTALRGTLITKGKDPGRLSFNYLLNCAKPGTYNCEQGGDFDAAQAFIHPKGAPAYGSDGSYNGVDGKCENKKVVASTISYKMLGTEGSTTAHAAFKDIAYVVGVLHQPVSIDIAADDTFENYSGGIYNGCSDESSADINHMVVIEGYSCETSVDKSGNCVFDKTGNLPKGVGTWLVRNSWNTTWGDDGYITMKATDKKGLPCNAVATDALYFDTTAAAE